MVKLLPLLLIPVLVLAGLGYWRYSAGKQNLATPIAQEEPAQEPIEVPKTLPNASTEERVKALEDLVTKLVSQVNSLKSQPAQSGSGNSDSKLSSVESAVTELKARVSALEKNTPAPAASLGSKSTIYIPLGSGGVVASTDWISLNSFQISLDPAQYPGYSSMQLEVNMRLNQPGGTLYARLYNSSAGSAISSEVTSTSANSSVVTSSTFTLPTGSKTYLLQAKTSDGTQAFLDTARIKVNF